ncbi:MAG: hypothetical protein EZS26_001587 [Candidatus Ordinivivax streblomastigis]|uniref:Uncharacterized protein n=1 Tax=Candidatus Ordinivivax streblomastigis TaxID=2540710 RepID=A0A5M8P1B6_9BACT|nr:MAG: hypothetical protein EZS26_001587 [Candidatus Ordinivivax streblomastigis]
MAIPVRSIPVLEGEAAIRFERLAREAEKDRGTIKFSQETIDSFKRIMEKSRKNFI